MRSLFLKIFLSFWLVQAVSVGVALIRFQSQQNHPKAIEAHWRRTTGDALNLYGKALTEMLESNPTRDVAAFTRGAEQDAGMRLSFLDSSDHTLAGSSPSPDVVELIKLVRASNTNLSMRTATGFALAEPMVSASGRSYLIVAEVARNPAFTIFPKEMLPQLAIYILVAGIVSLALARYLTRPIARLRAATQQLAAGDLSTRATEMKGKGDEVGELIKDFNRMATRLESLITAQRRLISDISHELRSPLARLSLALGLARKRSSPDAESSLDRIDLESKRLNDLIGQLLTLSRLESDVEGSTKEVLPVARLLKDIVKDANFEARSKSCSVRSAVEGECFVFGDSHLLRSAIENVVRNAVRHTVPESVVEVTVHCERRQGSSQRCIISIRDHGPGVPESELGNLFRPFYRLDSARGRETGGVGLGLSIAQRAIQIHDGVVEARNAIDGGLIVEIQIPAVNGRPEQVELLSTSVVGK